MKHARNHFMAVYAAFKNAVSKHKFKNAYTYISEHNSLMFDITKCIQFIAILITKSISDALAHQYVT